MKLVQAFLRDLFTGLTGDTFALGKVLAAATWLLGEVAFMGVGLRLLVAKGTIISDWALFFQFGAVWLAALVAAVISLITIQPKSEGGLIGKKEPTDAA